MTDKTFVPVEPQPLLIVISGPSGVGKDAVIQRMRERRLPFRFVVTATTRSPRKGEQHGVDYFFLSKSEFAEMINQGKLLEYAVVYDDYKGIPKDQVRQALESGEDVILRIDVQGAETIRKLYPQVLTIFLTTQDEAELVKRLENRKSEEPGKLDLRKATAVRELRRINEFDYMVVNCDMQLDETVDKIMAIITAEHHRVDQRKVTV